MNEHELTKFKHAQRRAEELKEKPVRGLTGRVLVFGGNAPLESDRTGVYEEQTLLRRVRLFLQQPGAALYRSMLLEQQRSRGVTVFKEKRNN